MGNFNLSDSEIKEIHGAFENTVLCARGNPAKESYAYAEKMAKSVVATVNRKYSEYSELKSFSTPKDGTVLLVDENKLTLDYIKQVRNYLKVKERNLKLK